MGKQVENINIRSRSELNSVKISNNLNLLDTQECQTTCHRSFCNTLDISADNRDPFYKRVVWRECLRQTGLSRRTESCDSEGPHS